MSNLASLISELCDDVLNGVQLRWINRYLGISYVKNNCKFRTTHCMRVGGKRSRKRIIIESLRRDVYMF